MFALMDGYTSQFQDRGAAYDQAMRTCRGARDEEFSQVVARLQPGVSSVGDVPCGGGYLRAYLPPRCQWFGHEPCESFDTRGGAHGVGGHRPLLPLPWADSSLEALVSLAGVHHLADKRPLFAEARRVVARSGRFVLSDVAAGSAQAGFLDEFIGKHNSTGHEGCYLDDRTRPDLEAAGWRVLADDPVDFHWRFRDVRELANFCLGLFDCRGLDADAMWAEVQHRLGTDSLPGGGVGLRWRLRTLVAEAR